MKYVEDIKCINSIRKKDTYRWYGHFYLVLPFSEIVNGNHSDIQSFKKRLMQGWNYKTIREATCLGNGVTSFAFIVSLIGIHRLLHPLAGTTNHLKGRVVDIIKTYDDIITVIKDVKTSKNNLD